MSSYRTSPLCNVITAIKIASETAGDTFDTLDVVRPRSGSRKIGKEIGKIWIFFGISQKDLLKEGGFRDENVIRMIRIRAEMLFEISYTRSA